MSPILQPMEAGSGVVVWLLVGIAMGALLLGPVLLRTRKLFRDALEQQENSDTLIENLSLGIYRSSIDGRQLSANRALVRLNGYDSEDEMLAGVADIGGEWYVDPRRRDQFREALARDGRVDDFISEIYRHKTREKIWISETARLVSDRKTGRPLFYEGSVQEVTGTVKRLQLEDTFQKLTNNVPGGLFQLVTYRLGGQEIRYLSTGVRQLTGVPIEEHLQAPSTLTKLVVPEDRDGFLESRRRAQERMEPWEHEFRIRARDGAEKWLRVSARPESLDGDTVWHGYLCDVSIRKKQEIEIEELAYFDPLTKLPNRRMFLGRMGKAIEACRLAGDHGALLFIDLDNFKTLNDTQGHDVGDALLMQVANRLRQCLDIRDLVARIGGDEFVVILEHAGGDKGQATLRAITKANRIVAALREEFDLGQVRHVASASVGLLVFDGSERRVEELLKMADIAMYQAKAAGRNGVALFDRNTMDRETERFELLGELRVAFPEGQLDLYFQPQVDDTGAITGAEALLRWNHPKFGLLSPAKFLPLAEQFGLSDDLFGFVFRRGVETLAGWQADPATAHLRLALNVSVQSFGGKNFVALVRDALQSSGVDATRLTFELTEYVMAKDQVRIAAVMRELKALGIRLSLDDFGTGYSSLAFLKALPFDEVKIDGGFVADIETNESNRALVKTILAMARTLGLTAVAEHVENVRQEAFLRAFGCDFLQGYLYGRAVPADRFLAVVSASRDHVAGQKRHSR